MIPSLSAAAMISTHAPQPAVSGVLVSVESLGALPLTAVSATATCAAGIARVVLRQRFANDSALPLEVTYSLPLPAEAAVSGFAFTLGERRVVGEVDRRASARSRYEHALATGHTASLVEEERDTLFTQSLGNVPPHTAIDAEITLDLRLRYLDEGRWELRLPTTVAPRYLSIAGRVPDADKIAQAVADGPLPLRLRLEADIGDTTDGHVECLSHDIVTEARGARAAVQFKADDGVPLDRDVVLRWKAATSDAAATLVCGRPVDNKAAHAKADGSRYAAIAVTPPLGVSAPTPRDLVLLLDTSGSMHGLPIEQAKRVAFALVSTLNDADTLEMISFSSTPQRWKRGATRMDRRGKETAMAWLSGLHASGGTEMKDAILEALAPVRKDAQRQVVLVTDGLIGFEQEIVRAILEGLPKGSRVHTVGVGTSINRTLTGGAARAGSGVEVIADPFEDPERVAARILPRTSAPLVTNLRASGHGLRRVAPEKLPDVFRGAPLVFAAEFAPEGGTIVIEGDTASGKFRREVAVPKLAAGEGSANAEKLFARELVLDLEMRAAAGHSVDGELEAVGLEHQIATRLTSWIAVTEDKTVDDGGAGPFRKVRMPHELPAGTAAEAFGLRAAAPTQGAFGGMPGGAMSFATGAPPAMDAAAFAPPPAPKGAVRQFLSRALGGGGAESKKMKSAGGPPPPPAAAPAPARGAPRMREESEREKADDDDVRSLVRAPAEAKADAMFDASDASDAKEESLSESAASAPGQGVRFLRGTIVARVDGRIIVTLTATTTEGAVFASRRDLVWVVLANGERRRARLAVPPPARLEAGESIRLIVELDAESFGVALRQLEFEDGAIVVTLDAKR